MNVYLIYVICFHVSLNISMFLSLMFPSFVSMYYVPCFYVIVHLCFSIFMLYPSLVLWISKSLFDASFYVPMDMCFYGSMFPWMLVSSRKTIASYLLVLKSSSNLQNTKKIVANAWKMGKLIGEKHNWVKNLPFSFCKVNNSLVIFKCNI